MTEVGVNDADGRADSHLSCFAEWAADRKVDLTLVSKNDDDKHLGHYELELEDND
jgi:hypothetical protein